MRKKILAGVAAVLMVASCVPANTNFGFSPIAPITASAAKAKLELDYVIISETSSGDIEITPKNIFDCLGVSDSVSTLNINFSKLKSTIVEYAGGSLSGKKVILKKPNTSLTADVNLAHINFTDDIITDVGASFASGCKTLQTVNFGSKINTIGSSAFSNCDHLQGTSGTKLDLSNIVNIDASAFNGTVEIQSIKFGSNLKTIGRSAFSGNTALKTLDLPAALTKIDDNAFYNCKALESVFFRGSNTISYIGISAFSNCTSLTTVSVNGSTSNTLPNGTADISCGTNLFSGCTSLQNFTWPKSFTIIPDGTFNGCTALTNFAFEGGATGSACATIGKSTFNKCESLTSIELPNANITILASAFNNCFKLENVVVSDKLTNVGEGAFGGCWVLTLYPRSDANKTKNKVVLPSTWQVISNSTFSNCEGITQVDISPATYIGGNAFYSCNSLQSIKIPDAVTTLYDNTFCDCKSLKNVVVSKKLAVLGKNEKSPSSTPSGCVFKDCISLETLTPSDATVLPYTIQFPASLGGVQKSSFENCPSIKYINFAKNSQFSVLGERAFYKCTGLLGSNEGGNANNTILMPTGVRDIFSYAFAECNSLKNIQFLGSVSTIGISAFQKCTALEDVIMNDTIQQVRDSAFADCSSLKSMPHTKEGKTAFSHIDTINASTFKNCTSLTEAFIPKNVTVIGNSAFSGCKTLEKVLWEKGSALATIDTSAFNGDEKLAVFTYQGGSANSTFPDSLTKINSNAFTKTALTKVTIGTPANGDKILLGTYAFSDNKSLISVDLSGSNIIEIPKYCFSNDTNLKTVLLPESSLTKLDDYAFSKCNRLHTFGSTSAKSGEYTLPESLTSIGDKVFADNFCMQVINIPASATSLSMSMFNIDLRNAKVEENGYTPLEAIRVHSNNPNYKSVDGILYSKDMTILYNRPINKKDPTYAVPSTVKTIKSYACVNSNLKNVVLNEGLQYIEEKAFNDCHSLEGVDFGKNGSVIFPENKVIFAKDKGKITLYGTTGSTAEAYASKNTSKVTFIDNDRAAAKLEIISKGGNVLTGGVQLAINDKTYTFGCKQTTASGKEAADNLIWSSSDVEVAVIDNTGKVTFKSKGVTTIKVTNANGTAVASITLTVADKSTLNDYIPGDVTGDGTVNVADISKIAAHIKGKKQINSTRFMSADVNGDGSVNVSDLSKIAAHVKGKKLLS